jgi:UDP-N-acetylglucosamine 2-epimerase (hydrolysing)
MNTKKVLFVTGTRADYGKLKPLISRIINNKNFNVKIFVTGMHLLKKYGHTYVECEIDFPGYIYKFINQNPSDSMDTVLGKTILGFSDYVNENSPDLIVIHGDRIEALACASVGALNNILVAHIEGGEVSGTIDESIRHSVSKLSHIHFVANSDAKNRLLRMGEATNSIKVIGSPEVDVMHSRELPTISKVKERYGIKFENFSIVLFHPVTTEINDLKENVTVLTDSLIQSERNFIVIYPNNDHGVNVIFDAYSCLSDMSNFKLLPSMRFEYFISLMKSADCMVGNSSAGVREAPQLGLRSINIGSRQNGRSSASSVINVKYDKQEILSALAKIDSADVIKIQEFGSGNTSIKFEKEILEESLWKVSKQKYFV